MDDHSPANADNNTNLIELLLKRQAELNGLLEMTQAINKNVSGGELVEMWELLIKNTLKVGKFHFFLKIDDHFDCISQFGPHLNRTSEYYQACKLLDTEKSPVKLSTHQNPSLSQYEYFIPVHHKDQALACILVGDLQAEGKMADNQVSYIQTLANVVVVAFENKKLFREQVQREKLKKEFELARQVQNMFIPQSLPKNNEFDVEAIYLPHESIGGDFYDFIELSPDEILWCIADVSGKGISAALLMANFQASLKALVSQQYAGLEKLLRQLNKIVYQNTKGDRFITIFIACYHKPTRTLRYVNAGHHPSILIRNDKAMPLQGGSTMIGVFDELPFVKEVELTLHPNDIVFNYTDGIIEFDGEEQLSEQDLQKLIIAQRHLTPAQINRNVIEHTNSLRSNRLATDDITLFSLKFF